jgi:hypothetical protein
MQAEFFRKDIREPRKAILSAVWRNKAGKPWQYNFRGSALERAVAVLYADKIDFRVREQSLCKNPALRYYDKYFIANVVY